MQRTGDIRDADAARGIQLMAVHGGPKHNTGRAIRSSHGPSKLTGLPKVSGASAKSTLRRYPRHIAQTLRMGEGAGELVLPEFGAVANGTPLAAAWLGHATILMRIGGAWVLTDPVLSERIGMKVGPLTLGVKRMVPLVRPESLPPIDLILLSHAHFDHLDRPSLRRLISPTTRVVTAARTARLIPKGFGEVVELPWDKDLDVGPLRIRAVKPNHWGARTLWDRHRGFNSYVVEAAEARVLYAGDTAMSQAFSEAGPVDMSVFGIGAYDPWIHAHASPEQVWSMHEQAGGRFLLPMHHSTFVLSDEPLDEPMRRLLDIAGEQRHRVICRQLGQLWTMPALEGAEE